MSDRFTHILQLWRYLGFQWLVNRAWYVAKKRSGLLQRQIPSEAWKPLSHFLQNSSLGEPDTYLKYRRYHAPPFLFDPQNQPMYQPYFGQWDQEGLSPLSLAEDIARGTLHYFQYTPVYMGFPPDWHRNPFTGQTVRSDRHWSQIDDFAYGDIKIIWEPNRFGFVYPLVRAYWRTGNEAYAELFWQLVEDWQVQNPPQLGPNWKCGQEASLRVMAWCFGLYGFLQSSVTTATRMAALAEMIAVSGQRIAANINYALNQHNNHGISESMGLWTIGLLFPELKNAARWQAFGRELLEKQAQELIYDDGAFVQHSVNYHRLMLHDFLWCIRLGEIAKRPFSTKLYQRVAQAGHFLYQIQAGGNGKVPHYGQDDGALILPLNNCDYQDFRPVIQAIHYLSHHTRCYQSGPWDEDLLWLFGQEALASSVDPPPQTELWAETGGYYTLHSDNSMLFVRCASFRNRPGQADMLHIDLWWHGHNIAMDAGTYSYNAHSPWNNSLATTHYHNTVTVDGLAQMDRVSKFLWLPWLHSKAWLQRPIEKANIVYWQGEHDGYRRLNQPVCHRRAILKLGGDAWLVVDSLDSKAFHKYRLHWLFPDWVYDWHPETGEIILHTPVGTYQVQTGTLTGTHTVSLVRADPDSPRGWHAPYYFFREPALSMTVTTQDTEAYFWTVLSPDVCHICMDDDTISLATETWKALVRLKKQQQDMLTPIAKFEDYSEKRL